MSHLSRFEYGQRCNYFYCEIKRWDGITGNKVATTMEIVERQIIVHLLNCFVVLKMSVTSKTVDNEYISYVLIVLQFYNGGVVL